MLLEMSGEITPERMKELQYPVVDVTGVRSKVLWPLDAKSWLIGKDSDAGRDWGQEEKGTREDEMAGWHHQLDGREFEWTPGVGDGQGRLACCNSWGCKESDTTERLNWTELNKIQASLVASVVKNPPANARDVGSIPGSGRSPDPGEGNGNQLQNSCLENLNYRGAWRVMGHRI